MNPLTIHTRFWSAKVRMTVTNHSASTGCLLARPKLIKLVSLSLPLYNPCPKTNARPVFIIHLSSSLLLSLFLIRSFLRDVLICQLRQRLKYCCFFIFSIILFVVVPSICSSVARCTLDFGHLSQFLITVKIMAMVVPLAVRWAKTEAI